MSNNLVIVAIPAADDHVWKISSEKVPHLTLLFLGDADTNPNVDRIMQFVAHAVNICQHGQFMLSVDYRDVLGPDQADVLFFEKDWSFKWIDQFRSQLLQNTDIKTAFDSAKQFEEWTPHLTMGYPDTPAKEDDRDYGIGWVSFDRIAVWTGDYSGPDFRLKWTERDWGGSPELAYSALAKSGEIVVSDILQGAVSENEVRVQNHLLEHHGIKGMKWGKSKTETRKDTFDDGSPKGGGKKVTPKKIAKLDKKFEKDSHSVPTFIGIHNRAAELANKHDIDRINNKPEYKDANFNKLGPDHPLSKKYEKEHQDAFVDRLRQAADEMGTNASGTKKLSIRTVQDDRGDGWTWDVSTTDVKHTDETLRVHVSLDSKGHVVKIDPVETTMTQTSDLGAEFLAHHGIKGMRWGHRSSKPPPSAVNPSAMSVVPHGSRIKTQVKVSGGENHPAHEDAIKVAESRVKLKKSGPAALSNKELKDVANRLQLEQQVQQLTASGGKKFVTNLFKQQSQQQVNRFVQEKAKEKFG